MITKSILHTIASKEDKAARKKAAAKAEKESARLKKKIAKAIEAAEAAALASAKKGKFYMEVTVDDDIQSAIVSHFGTKLGLEISHNGDGIAHKVVGVSWKDQ